MRLADILYRQGFGSRRECAARIAAGTVAVGGRTVDDAAAEFQTAGLAFTVDGESWPYVDPALVMLHKPAGYECSRKPGRHPSVMNLLPAPLQRRGVQPVGRLDADTTGLLLLTDEGAAIHRWTSPRHHLRKVYEVGCRHAVDATQVDRLLCGVVLHDDPQPVRAASCVATGPTTLQLTLTEGRYHQVKRMVAAVGNRVETLHRSAFGALRLPDDLAAGQWRWVDAEAVEPPPQSR